MPAIDTNILVRFLVKDDEEQFQQVLSLFKRYRESAIKINLPVLMETYWVLTSTYNYSKVRLIDTFRMLLKTQGLKIQSGRVIEKALKELEGSSAGFEDCLIAELNNSTNEVPTYTFDKKASKLKGMKLLK